MQKVFLDSSFCRVQLKADRVAPCRPRERNPGLPPQRQRGFASRILNRTLPTPIFPPRPPDWVRGRGERMLINLCRCVHCFRCCRVFLADSLDRIGDRVFSGLIIVTVVSAGLWLSGWFIYAIAKVKATRRASCSIVRGIPKTADLLAERSQFELSGDFVMRVS
jgi:hypothetical protein